MQANVIAIYMGGSRKKFRGGDPNILGIKVAQLNVLVVRITTKNFISDFPNTGVVN